MKKVIILLVFFSTLLFASVGKISAFSGDVNIERNNNTLKASVGFGLLEKDLVKTYDNARAQIVFDDGTVISIGKNAILDIAEFVNDSTNPSTDLRVVEGAFKAITGSIGKIAPDRFKLKTKSASIGIRGTVIFGDQAMIACTQGEIEVEVGGIIHILPAGMMIRIKPDGTPTDPEPIEDDDLGGIAGDVEGDGINPDDMEIEPLPTEDEGQDSQSDTPDSSQNDGQNPNDISQDVNDDTTKDTFQEVVKNQEKEEVQELPEPFEFDGNGYRVEFQSGSLGYWEKDGDADLTPTSHDNNGDIIGALNLSGPAPVAGPILDNVTTLGFQEGDDVYWGYWEVNTGTQVIDAPWIVGIKTPTSSMPSSESVSFTGTVIGNVWGQDEAEYRSILQNANNNITATIDFGGTFENMTGSISFDDDFGNKWRGTMAGDANTYTGSFYGQISTALGGINLASDVNTYDGHIYGEPNIKAIGGGFEMLEQDGLYKATGVFKAEKQ